MITSNEDAVRKISAGERSGAENRVRQFID